MSYVFPYIYIQFIDGNKISVECEGYVSCIMEYHKLVVFVVCHKVDIMDLML